jgi:hypothetical protein
LRRRKLVVKAKRGHGSNDIEGSEEETKKHLPPARKRLLRSSERVSKAPTTKEYGDDSDAAVEASRDSKTSGSGVFDARSPPRHETRRRSFVRNDGVKERRIQQSGQLYCDMCDSRQPGDNFSTMQQREYPPLPKWIIESYPEIAEGDYRFCLKHTQGDQKGWVLRLMDIAQSPSVRRLSEDPYPSHKRRLAAHRDAADGSSESSQASDASKSEEAPVEENATSSQRRLSTLVARYEAAAAVKTSEHAADGHLESDSDEEAEWGASDEGGD